MRSSPRLRQATQLRRSYLAISSYIRAPYTRPLSSLRRCFACQRVLRSTGLQKTSSDQHESQAGGGQQSVPKSNGSENRHDPLLRYKHFFDLPPATTFWGKTDLRPNQTCTMHGYITTIRRATKTLDFVDFVDPQLRQTLQIVVDENVLGHNVRAELQNVRPHTPVAVTGQLVAHGKQSTSGPTAEQGRSPATSDADEPKIIYHSWANKTFRPTTEEDENEPPAKHSFRTFKLNPYVGEVDINEGIEMILHSFRLLNRFPDDIVARAETNFSPEQRHLQLRTNSHLRKTLQARSKAQAESRKYLFVKGFDEIETPLLFKSTPEGAREFLVPTRQKGLAYALPQSPQQFKQILMASGVSRYFQFARCFRDEDMRADRQPEFTQLDLEMSFASTKDVMKLVERLIQVLWETFFRETIFQDRVQYLDEYKVRDIPHHEPLYFPQLTYNEAMMSWGSDKPDTRLGSKIHQVQGFLDPTLKSKISSLKNPIIDVMRVRVSSNAQETLRFIRSFLDSPSAAAYMNNPHGVPGIFIFDVRKPMNGLSAFEHEAAEKIKELLQPQRGDLLILQARPDRPFLGESATTIGNLRRDLQFALVSNGTIRKPWEHEFLWITDFPLFSPASDSDPGQGGKAGIKSTHHPFTAPKTLEDLEKMATEPLSCTADHFDLVIDGVEVGGGSRRIHDNKAQELVLKDILKVPEKEAEEFRPLLEALRAGCPPHAGFALGFDRLMAILRQVGNVRDVIAFPKSAHGEDKMVGAPSPVGAQRWAGYHMAVQGGDRTPDSKMENEGLTTASREAKQELRSTAESISQRGPGSTQPDDTDITPSTPS